MGLIEDNPEGYKNASVLTHVDKAKGHLLQIHGNADDNVQLAKERARQVAVQLEFAGVSPRRIRVEGHGFDRPMVQCPSGMACPEGIQERSRRTELYLIPNRRP